MFTHPVTSQAVVEWVVETTPWLLAVLLVPMTHLGSVLVIGPLLAIAYLRRPKLLAPWLGTVLVYYVSMAGIKSLNGATRPVIEFPVEPDVYPAFFSWWYDHATAISSTSFPSGNAMLATVVAGLITLDLDIATLRQRAVCAGSGAVLVAYSRVALGVHYPVDVVAGVVFGLCLLVGLLWLRSRVTDTVTVLFVGGVLIAGLSMWVTTPITQPPTVDALQGSNRPIAFGVAVGGLIGWQLKQRYANRLTPTLRFRATALLVVLGSMVSLSYGSMGGLPGLIAQTVVLSAVFVFLPWTLPTALSGRQSTTHPTTD